MEELVKEVSPFRRFAREEWSALRADTPMTLTQQDLDELRGLWREDRRWQPRMDEAARAKLYAGWKKAVTRSFGWLDGGEAA